MISTIRTVAKSLAVFAAMVALLQAPPAQAARLFFAASGSGGACTISVPCTFAQAATSANDGDEIACADSSDNSGATITKSITVDCSGTTGSMQQLAINGASITVVLRNFTMWHLGTPITLQAGTLIIDNVHIFKPTGLVITAQPTAPSVLVVRNSLIDGGNAGAVLLDPASGGSLSAQFDHVVITGNNGGGIKTDTTNGVVTLDVTDSQISNNGGNGINAVAGASQNIVSIKSSVIARNGGAGVQANGVNAGVLVATSLLDQNASGATSIVSSGNMFTYGNNDIVGAMGSGFNNTAMLH